MIELSKADARRIAVRAQLLDARPADLVETVRRLTFVQLEPTAYVAPTADIVLWSRLGASYEPADLEAAMGADLFELNLLARPMEDLALFKAEMALPPRYESTAKWLDDNEEFHDEVLERLELDGPLTARDIPDTALVSWPSSGWNNNRNVMMMLDCLAARGEVGVVGRRGRDRLWDLAERAFHADIPTLPLDEAKRIRDDRRLRSQGVVPLQTPDLPVETTRIGAAGEDAVIEGLKGAWRVDPEALGQPFAGRAAILSPLDGLVRDRKRMTQLFEFDYTLEMYKPAQKRRWGYWAMPILHGDRLVGKLDAQADRDRGELVIHALHEDEPFTAAVAAAVDAEIDALAAWLGLDLKR